MKKRTKNPGGFKRSVGIGRIWLTTEGRTNNDANILWLLFYSILFYSIKFYSIIFYSILFYSILSYSISCYSYSILPIHFRCNELEIPVFPAVLIWLHTDYNFEDGMGSTLLYVRNMILSVFSNYVFGCKTKRLKNAWVASSRPTMRPHAFLGISSYRDAGDSIRKPECGNNYLCW